LFCGDTVIDAATAQAGGCGFCAVLNGTTPREAFRAYPHVHIAEDLAGLQGWLGL
jgi:phosphoglycolate phosphatase-like HAD superfamily hydrolase